MGHQEPKGLEAPRPTLRDRALMQERGSRVQAKSRRVLAAAGRAGLQRMACPPNRPRKTGRTRTQADRDGEGRGRGAGPGGLFQVVIQREQTWESRNSHLLGFKLYQHRHCISVTHLCDLQSLAHSRCSINVGAGKDTVDSSTRLS